ncbi:MAG: hypothetical protein U0905_17225 [Pirellulales bacterium]
MSDMIIFVGMFMCSLVNLITAAQMSVVQVGTDGLTVASTQTVIVPANTFAALRR